MKNQEIFIGQSIEELKSKYSVYFDINVKKYFCITELKIGDETKLINQYFKINQGKLENLEINILFDYKFYRKKMNYMDDYFLMKHLKNKMIQINNLDNEIILIYYW